MSLKLAISLCPNDIYVYSGLLSQQIDHSYNFRIGDLGELNKWAINDEVDLIKISAGLFPRLKNRYRLSKIGSSFADKSGPKLVCQKNRNADLTKKIKIACPSLDSTASFVMKHFFSNIVLVEENLKKIPELVSAARYDAGIVVNESMNDLDKYGLDVQFDLASLWFQKMAYKLPLGLLVVSNDVTQDEQDDFEQDVRDSIIWAKKNHKQAISIAQKWCLEKNIAAIENHIKNFTVYTADNESQEESLRKFMSLF